MFSDSKKDIVLSVTDLNKNPLNYAQVSVLADDILKNVEFDALRIVYNKFHSVVAFLPTVSTVLSPEESEVGGKLGELDSYEIEGGETKGEILQNLAEFQFSCRLCVGILRTIMVPLGWIGGVVGLILTTAISLYANTLIAKLHEFGGKKTHLLLRSRRLHLW